MEVYPEKIDGTLHIMCYAHDALYRPFFRGMPRSTEKLLQSFHKGFLLCFRTNLFRNIFDLVNDNNVYCVKYIHVWFVLRNQWQWLVKLDFVHTRTMLTQYAIPVSFTHIWTQRGRITVETDVTSILSRDDRGTREGRHMSFITP